MPKLIITFSFLSVILGCASTSRFDTRIDKSVAPPVGNFLNKWKSASAADLANLEVGSNEINIGWWKAYTQAMLSKDTEPASACENFKKLSQDMEFPLHDLALLRSYEVCTNKNQLLELPEVSPPWYRDLFVDSKLKDALATEDLKDDIAAYIEKARAESIKLNKENFYLAALDIAKKSESSESIKEIETLLYRNSPRLNPQPTFKDLSSIAMDYRHHREFDKALTTYQKIIKDRQAKSEDLFQAYKNIRQTFKVAQRRSEYIQATAELVNWAKKEFQKNKKDKKSITRLHDSQILLARTLWTEDQTSNAVKALNETHKLLRGLYPMDEVYFTLGRIDEEKGNSLKALEYFEASFAQPISLSGLRDKISWLKSWNYYKLQKWEEARNSFVQMKETAKDASDISRAKFWLARTLKKLNLDVEATAELTNLIQDDPLGYYGMLATRELNLKFTPLKNEEAELHKLSLLNSSELTVQSRLTIEWLIAVNEMSFAEKAITHAADNLRKRNVTSEETWLTISSAYARTGLYLPLFAAIGALETSVKDQLLNNHPDLLFPTPFEGTISASAKKSGVPAEFIYSIIRQESAFNPLARSPADAFGLMQLLPNIAQNLAKQNQLVYQRATDLFIPEINIPLGAFELKTLMRKYNNQFILAVSGYNANDSAIRGWLKTRYRKDSVEFIEEVPYEETRTYIKLVMRNYVFYKRLLHSGESIDFPEDLLRLKK